MVLEELLLGLEVAVKAFAICAVGRGADLSLPPLDFPTIHYSLAGAGVLRLTDGPVVPFKRHTVMILPPGRPTIIESREPAVDASDGGVVPLAEGLRRFESGVGKPEIVIACGSIAVTYQGTIGLFNHLVEPVVDDFACEDGICRPFDLLLHELAAPRLGTTAMADALMWQCLILILRRYCDRGGKARLPWLAALEDPRLNRALGAMLDQPSRPFSLEELAEIATMSRSAFAARFATAFDRSPMDFLKELRLRRAAELLRSTDLPVKTIAGRVGYASRSYFSRAFKAWQGIDPAGYRQSPPVERLAPPEAP